MTVKEARKLIAVFMVTYPNYKPIDTELAAKVWSDATEEYSYEQVDMALKAYMKSSTSGFAPTPGQLIDKIHSITKPQELNEMEAWALVYKAICNSTYNSAEEFSKLPPLVQKAVGLPDNLRTWAMEENMNVDVVSSNFKSTYQSVVKREREISKMPNEIKKIIQNNAQGSYSSKLADLREQTIKSLTERKESEIKALEAKSGGVPVPEKYKQKLTELRGALSND